jgi:hypothetical protein
MNRLVPLITRAATLRPLPPRPQLALAAEGPWIDEAGWQDDLQFFVTAWLGGLLFVGTLLG